ncbi:MAG: M15 family metallopeptidase [Deltaproteobacteria bacterium]|nr:M15 family metallopeptidase [Deltaproteobacteria bacterium]
MYQYQPIIRRRRYEPDFTGLAGSVLATDPRTNAQCRADERRIRQIIEPSPSDLVNIAPRYLADPTHPKQMHRAAYGAYVRMKAAAEAAGVPGNLLTITSGYRSVAHQQRLWADALKRYGSPQAARKWVAPPGGSPHHTGRAIDLWLGTRNSSDNIATLRATLPYKWLVCNAGRFGFFPYANEPWHWEYNPDGLVSAAPRPVAPPPRPAPAGHPSVVSETQLIVDAVRRGIRDENHLTNIVFHARHPERRGQPLRQDEQPLVREWLDIRDRVVRPGLGRAAPLRPAPTTPPTGLDPQQKTNMYVRTHEGLGQAFGQHGLGQCDTGSATAMTHQQILDTIQCELKRRFAGPNDPRLFTRRRRLRELFNGVPPSEAKPLFDQLQRRDDPLAQLFRFRLATPTRKELLSILFFAEYDLRLGPDIPANPRMTSADKTQRIQDIQAMTILPGPPPTPGLLLIRRNARATAALLGSVPPAAAVPSALDPATRRLSTAQLDLFREFFPDGAGGINFDDFRRSFVQFANGELRDPTVPGKREPNGGFYFLFAEFAFLCIDSTIERANWTELLRVFVQTQEIFMHVYRPPPARPAPAVGAALPAPCAPPRRSLNDFSDGNFVLVGRVGQSVAARKAALRVKYARMNLDALRRAAGENMLRAQCMP